MPDNPQTLGDAQRLFMRLLAQLLPWVYKQPGYELTAGEFYRTPEQAAWDAQHGTGIANSNHTRKIAADLNLFVNGEFQTTVESYRPLGEYWKSLHPLCRWGGDFMGQIGGQGPLVPRPDADHFSLEWQGVE